VSGGGVGPRFSPPHPETAQSTATMKVHRVIVVPPLFTAALYDDAATVLRQAAQQ
jgi:hypothetical protein